MEAANDYHYQIRADQIAKLCDALSCSNTEKSIVKALIKLNESWVNPIEIATFLKDAEIKYQVFS